MNCKSFNVKKPIANSRDSEDAKSDFIDEFAKLCHKIQYMSNTSLSLVFLHSRQNLMLCTTVYERVVVPVGNLSYLRVMKLEVSMPSPDLITCNLLLECQLQQYLGGPLSKHTLTPQKAQNHINTLVVVEVVFFLFVEYSVPGGRLCHLGQTFHFLS